MNETKKDYRIESYLGMIRVRLVNIEKQDSRCRKKSQQVGTLFCLDLKFFELDSAVALFSL